VPTCALLAAAFLTFHDRVCRPDSDSDLALKQAALKLGYVDEATFVRVVDPKKMAMPAYTVKTGIDPEPSVAVSNNSHSLSETSDLFGHSREARVGVHVHQGASENAANSAVSTFPF
jgi:hypothetical protein